MPNRQLHITTNATGIKIIHKMIVRETPRASFTASGTGTGTIKMNQPKIITKY
jgi:hypothetical protein